VGTFYNGRLFQITMFCSTEFHNVERVIHEAYPCTYFRTKFEHGDFLSKLTRVELKKHFQKCSRETDILIPREITQFFVVLDGFSSSSSFNLSNKSCFHADSFSVKHMNNKNYLLIKQIFYILYDPF